MRNEVCEPRFACVGTNTGDPGSSVSGVVGREESSPASLQTLSKIDDVRLVVDCGELGPEDASIEW